MTRYLSKKAPAFLLCFAAATSLQAATYSFNGTEYTQVSGDSDAYGKNIFLVNEKYTEPTILSLGNGDAGDPLGKIGASYNFGPSGVVHAPGGNSDMYSFCPNDNNPQAFKFNGVFETAVDPAAMALPEGYYQFLRPAAEYNPGDYIVVVRVLVAGENFWYRDGPNGPDYERSVWAAANGDSVMRILNSGQTGIESFYFNDNSGEDPGFTETAADYGKYAFVVGSNFGVGIVYVAQVIPEPSTIGMTLLGLVGVMALAARRRRR